MRILCNASFAMQWILTFFSTKNNSVAICNFNKSLTNDIFNFEQLTRGLESIMLREWEVTGANLDKVIPRLLEIIPVAYLLGTQHFGTSTGNIKICHVDEKISTQHNKGKLPISGRSMLPWPHLGKHLRSRVSVVLYAHFFHHYLTNAILVAVEVHMSSIMRKPTICICENREADQLCSNHEADQRLCFRYMDSFIPLLSKFKLSSF